MSVTPTDLLSQVKTLHAAATSEVELRTAVSRAYYAAYHQANAFHHSLARPGRLPADKTGVHATLAHQLLHPSIPASFQHQKSRDIGRHLTWLHDKRVKADYKLARTLVAAECDEVLRRVERIFALSS